MVAEALLVARFIDAATKAGMSRGEIATALSDVAERSGISEIWVTDEAGQVEFTTVKGTSFQFPTDREADGQAAAFSALLDGSDSVVVQDACERDLDGAHFRYVGVAGIDKPRIVQVGVRAED